MSKILVAYFSATGTTRMFAEDITEITQGDLYEIQPKDPYVKKDLNWMNPFSRTTREMKGFLSHPALLEKSISLQEYSTIFLGFPIWWYKAPTIICSFLEQNDLKDKRIILFATSGGSEFGKTIQQLNKYVDETTMIEEGRVFNQSYTVDELKQWIKKEIEND